MAVKVNPPPQLRIPAKFRNDPDLFNFFNAQGQILFQLWQRTGGSDDKVDDTSQELTNNESRVSRNAAKINSLELKEFQVVTTTEDFQTERNQIVICKNTDTITVTLDPQAVENDELHIKRRDARVDVVGLIDGVQDRKINVKNYSLHLAFDGTEWNQI